MNELIRDRLFIQEIMNDLSRTGGKYTKSWFMLKDWSRELRELTHMRGRTKRMFKAICGKELW